MKPLPGISHLAVHDRPFITHTHALSWLTFCEGRNRRYAVALNSSHEVVQLD
jgi:hypothetical protein